MNFYETLGVSRNSDPEVIDAAYRVLMKKYHPDRWQGDKAEAEPRAKSINEAYSTLRDPTRRRAYDKLLSSDPAQAPRARPQTRQPSSSASTRQRAGRRQPCRSPQATARAAVRHTPADARIVAVAAISAILGLVVFAIATLGSNGSESERVQPLALPPISASLLSGGRKQTFCIGNRASNRVEYTLYWGGTTGRRYALDPGHRMIHSSAYSAAPLVEFFGSEAGEPVRVVVGGSVTSGGAESCQPSYSFANEPPDLSRWPGDSRFGLYPEERPEIGGRSLPL